VVLGVDAHSEKNRFDSLAERAFELVRSRRAVFCVPRQLYMKLEDIWVLGL
jgi:hypothetical protein